MTPLPEYLPSAENRLLMVLEIKDAELAQAIAVHLGALGQVARRRRGNGVELVFLAGAAGRTRESLRLLDKLLGDREGMGGRSSAVEIIETRLVPAAVGQTFLARDEPVGLAPPIFLPAYGLTIQAGNAFGSGQHPSTRLAIVALEHLAGQPLPFPAKVLDVGCGTGILALISARLGADRVLGIDVCAQSLAVAEVNRQHNVLHDRVAFSSQPLAEIPGSYDLVIANLAVSVLQYLLAEVVRHSAPGGHLILAGCQGRQGERLRTLLSRQPLTLTAAFQEDGWHAFLLLRT